MGNTYGQFMKWNAFDGLRHIFFRFLAANEYTVVITDSYTGLHNPVYESVIITIQHLQNILTNNDLTHFHNS